MSPVVDTESYREKHLEILNDVITLLKLLTEQNKELLALLRSRAAPRVKVATRSK